MKKFFLLLFLIPSILCCKNTKLSEFIQEVKSTSPNNMLQNLKIIEQKQIYLTKNKEKTIKVYFDENQYAFFGVGDKEFSFQIIESSGNEWRPYLSDDSYLHTCENIMDKGYYTIKFKSDDNNLVSFAWGYYNERR